jgi:hypothetical protein
MGLVCRYVFHFRESRKEWDNCVGVYFISESLEKNGISVWVDVVGLTAGVDFLSKIGEAILDAKVNTGRGIYVWRFVRNLVCLFIVLCHAP